MKITLNKNNFEIVLNNFQAFLDKKDSSQITSHIYLETIENKLLLKATDYEISIQSTIDILHKFNDGIATIEGRKILSIIKPLDDGEIILETKGEKISIYQNEQQKDNDFSELLTFNAKEFNSATQFPEITNDAIKIDINPVNFIDSMKKVVIATESKIDTMRVELKGTLLDITEHQCNFVGTDTRRLAIVNQKTQINSTYSLIIPKRAIMEITKLFYDEFEIFINKQPNNAPTMLFIKSQNYIFSTKLIHGKYPDYKKIIPKEFATQLKLPKEEVIKALKKMNAISESVKITINTNNLIFETMNAEGLENAKTTINITTNVSKPITLGINSRYILDFVNFIANSEFEILINDNNMPFLLKDDTYSTIIMPILC